MYSVPNNNFHTAVANGGRTRIRVYLFDNTVTPTSDYDVQTNGTLLKMLPGDEDSNSRIEQSGVVWRDYFNRDTNLKMGDTVSNQVSFAVINTDGAYTGFNFQRCKIYLDVYYEQGAEWISCPMGVYVFQTPESTTGNTIYLTAFDMMQDLNQIADTWFNGLTWTGGLSLNDLFAALATQCGKPSTYDPNMINGSVSFTEAPFVSINRTYRDILSWIAEASCSIAKFDRDGYLALRSFSPAVINGHTYLKNVDILGCGVFDLTMSEYAVPAVTGLSIKSVNYDDPVLVGTGDSVCFISGNPFIADSNSTDITTKGTPILTKLAALGSYTPICMTSFTDWCIEAGDIINVLYKATTYQLPIFQQTISWSGGRAKAQFSSSGDKDRPTAETKEERDDYRIEKEFTDRVTFTDLSTGGKTIINGSNIHGGTLTLGGLNDENGVMYVKDASNETMARIDNQGIEVFQQDPNTGLNSVVLAGGYFLMQTGGTTSVFINRYNTGDGYIQVCDDQGNPRALISGGEGVCRSIDINGYYRAQIASDGTVQTRDQYDVLRFDMGTGGSLSAYNGSGIKRVEIDSTNGAAVVYDLFGNERVKATEDGVVIGGTLDLTARHCSATLSSAGWYRVFLYSSTNDDELAGGKSANIRITITREGIAGNSFRNEVHFIDFSLAYGSYIFSNETSVTRSFAIDKIRYGYDLTNHFGFIDIHCKRNDSNPITVSFNVATDLETKGEMASVEPYSVADAPSGETVLATHDFVANTHISGSVVGSYGTIYYDRKGGVCSIYGDVNGVPTGAWTTLATGLPAPARTQFFIAQNGASTDFVMCDLNTSGELKFYGRGSYSSGYPTWTYVCN